MMNPGVILALVLAFLGVGGSSFMYGDHVGTLGQQVKDQKQFDQINADIAKNKKIADAIYRNAQAIIIQQAADRALSDNQREKERQTDAKTNTDLRAKYDATILRFRAPQTSGLGNCGANTNSPGTGTASNSGTVEVQIPDEITRKLRSIVFDADSLSTDYTLLYNWAHDPNLCFHKGE